MPKDAHVAVPRWRWIGAAGLVVRGRRSRRGLVSDQGSRQARRKPPPQHDPGPGGRRAAGGDRKASASPSSSSAGSRPSTRSSCAPASRASSKRSCSREGQDVKTGDLLYQIEKVQFQAPVDQAKANLAVAEAELTNAQLQYDRSLELSKRQFSPQSQVDQDKAALDSAAGQGPADAGGADAGPGQSRLHRHPRADRRPHRPHRLHRRQSRQSGERRAGDHRQPGSDLCAVPGERARPRDHPRGAAQGGRRASPRSISACACRTARTIRIAASGTSPIRRSTSRPTR